jgi:hypothetical protein
LADGKRHSLQDVEKLVNSACWFKMPVVSNSSPRKIPHAIIMSHTKWVWVSSDCLIFAHHVFSLETLPGDETKPELFDHRQLLIVHFGINYTGSGPSTKLNQQQNADNDGRAIFCHSWWRE